MTGGCDGLTSASVGAGVGGGRSIASGVREGRGEMTAWN